MKRKTRALSLLLALLMLVGSAVLGGSTLAALNRPLNLGPTGLAQSSNYLNAMAYQNPIAPQDVNVTVGSNFFSPQVVTITVGTNVVWSNTQGNHTVAADDGSFASGNLAVNAVYSHTYTTTGSFGYYCTYHGSPGNGMYGTVIVQGGPATNTPTAVLPTSTATSVPATATSTGTVVPATPTITPTPNPNNRIIGSQVLGQDLQMSTVLGFGSLNANFNGMPFGTGGYVLLNYVYTGTNFIPCPCPPSPNQNDYSLLNSTFASVNISITRGSGLSQPITQLQNGGSVLLNSGAHKFSGLYDQGPDPNNETLRMELTNLPSTPFRITVYNNNNPGNGGRSGTMVVMNGSGSTAQLISYGSGAGSVTQWLVTGSTSLSIIETNAGGPGDLPVGGILFDDGDGSGATPTVTNTPLPSNTPTTTSTPLPTNTPGGATNTPTQTGVPSVTPTLCPIPFTDINGNVFYTAIVNLYCRGVVNGTSPTTYSPAGTSTRAQFAKVVVLGFAIPAFTPNGGTSTFTDVPNSYFAYQYIETGYAAGVLSGFDSATCAAIGATYPCYGPNRPITRAQLTKLVVAAGGFSLFTPTSGQTFSDVGRSNVFFTYIETAARYGIVGGYSDNTFRPNNNIRRDEMAQIVYKGITTPPLRLVVRWRVHDCAQPTTATAR